MAKRFGFSAVELDGLAARERLTRYPVGALTALDLVKFGLERSRLFGCTLLAENSPV